MMRAALAELAEHDHVEVVSVAVRADHDRVCGCDDEGRGGCWDGYWPSRAERVSARRALHTLERRGMVTLSRWQFALHEAPPVLIAKRCQDGKDVTLATHTGRRNGGRQ